MANQVIIWAPACCMRAMAALRVVLLKVPEASTTTNTSKPSFNAESAGKATQTSVTMPAMTSCLRPVALTAFTKSSLSHALIWPGRGMNGAFGNILRISGSRTPFGPCSKLVVSTVGRLKCFAVSATAMTLFLNSAGVKSRTSDSSPT